MKRERVVPQRCFLIAIVFVLVVHVVVPFEYREMDSSTFSPSSSSRRPSPIRTTIMMKLFLRENDDYEK